MDHATADPQIVVPTGELGTVQETLLTPLCARADQYGRSDAIVDDRWAAEMVSRIDYDFDSIRRFPDTLTGCAIRAAVFDGWIQRYLQSNHDVAVVLVGVGLDTTCDRNDDGKTHWYELDFADVIRLRSRLFPATGHRTPIAGSVLDSDWIDVVKSGERSRTLFQIAGVTMYLPPEHVRGMFTTLADHFPGCEVLFDTCSTLAKRNSHRWEATVRTTGASYQWGIDDPHDIRDWDDRFDVREVQWMMDHHRAQWSWKARIATTFSRRLRHAYQLNRAVFE